MDAEEHLISATVSPDRGGQADFALRSRAALAANLVATVLAAGMLASSVWLARDNLLGNRASVALGDRLHTADTAAEALLSTLKDAETGQRGFLLTGDPAYLEPYETARARLDIDLARLASAEPGRVERLRALAAEKMDELEETIALHREGRAEEAMDAVRAGRGKRVMDAARAEVDALHAEDAAPLAEAWARAGSAWRWTAVLGLAAAASLLLGGVALAQNHARRAAIAGFSRLERLTRAFDLAQGMLREPDGRITHWTSGAERLYGHRPEEALGRNKHELLRTRFPLPLPEIEEALRRDGRWQGELAQRRRDGTEVVVASHWALHRGGPGEPDEVIEVFNDITALKHAEAALRDSEARLRRVLDNLFAFVGVLAPDGTVLNANRAPLEAAGIALEEVRGRPLWECVWWTHDPAEAARVREACARAAAGEASRYDAVVRMAGDSRMVIDFQIAPLRDEAGRITHLIPSATDITARAGAEARLREGEERLRLALDAADLGTWRWEVGRGTDGLEWDSRCKALFGFSPDAPVDYAAWAEAIPPEDRAQAEAGLARALDSADPRDDYNCEYRAAHPDGRVLRLAADGRAFFETDPAAPAGRRAVRIMGTIRDVTEIRRAEQERERVGALLRAIGEATPDLIFAKDRQSRMLYANPAMLALVGKPAEAVIGRSDGEWHHDPAEAAAFLAVDRRVVEGGRSEVVEEAFTVPGGPTRVFLSTKAPMQDAGGAVVGLVAVTRDITERKRAEQHRELLVNELNHRVKNTLATVQSVAAQTLRVEGCDDAREAFEDRLIALSNAHDLLTRENWGSVPLRALAEHALAPFGLSGGAGARLRVSGPPVRVGPKAAIALAMAMHELATNAAKYGALSNEVGRVDLEWGGDGERLDLAWREAGGPPVTAPARRGFGSRLIERGLAAELGGRVALRFEPGGVVCEIHAPALAGQGEPAFGI